MIRNNSRNSRNMCSSSKLIGQKLSFEELLSSSDQIRFISFIKQKGVPNCLFHKLFQAKNFKFISLLIEMGEGLQDKDHQGKTPLLLSASKGLTELARILLQKKVQVDQKDNSGKTALDYAVQKESSLMVQLIMRKLKNNGQAKLMIQKYKPSPAIKKLLLRKSKLSQVDKEASLVKDKQNAPCNTTQRKLNTDGKMGSSGHKGLSATNKGAFKNRMASPGGKLDSVCKKLQNLFFEQKDQQDERPEIKGMEIIRSIGKGSFGQVFLAELRGQLIAIKTLDKKLMNKLNMSKYLSCERKIMQILDHPFIMKLRFACQTPTKYILGMDYLPKGDLSTKVGAVTQQELRRWAAELVLAIQALHKENVIYRDLKPENVLLDVNGHIRLCDFGLSKMGISQSVLTYSFCGTYAYVAPQMLNNKGHGQEIDWYLLGVFLYELSTGRVPFKSFDRQKLFHMILHEQLVFPLGLDLDEHLKGLITALMNRNPKQRLGSKGSSEVKDHPFFKDTDFEAILKMGRCETKGKRRVVQAKAGLTSLVLDLCKERDPQWSFYQQRILL